MLYEHQITVTARDITKQQIDATVNPANSQLITGGGMESAIKFIREKISKPKP
jgi:O-acetyl-ADP-ribose deacetylase (regulator of RNase III)